jgi:hypothetical protein
MARRGFVTRADFLAVSLGGPAIGSSFLGVVGDTQEVR